jgi:hypothetical protein
MKKAIVFSILTVLLVALFLGTSLLVKTPPKAEALYIYWDVFIEILCDECHGQYFECCKPECYKQYLENTHTDDYQKNFASFNECVDSCALSMAYMCN